MTANPKLIELIKREALRLGDFTLASGKKSKFYLDCRSLVLTAEGASLVALLLLERLERAAGQGYSVDAVGGLELGAVPLVSSLLAMAHDLPAWRHRRLRGFIVRKDVKSHGTGKAVEGPLHRNDRVAVLEDVATTGASALKAVFAARQLGAKPSHVFCIIDREDGAREAIEAVHLRFESLLTLKDLGL
jgi:orotate phosphoribosyltransferase